MRVSPTTCRRLLPFRNTLSLESEDKFTLQESGETHRLLDEIVKFLWIAVAHQILLVSRNSRAGGPAAAEGVVHARQRIDPDRPGLFAGGDKLLGSEPLDLFDLQPGGGRKSQAGNPVGEARLIVHAFALWRDHEGDRCRHHGGQVAKHPARQHDRPGIVGCQHLFSQADPPGLEEILQATVENRNGNSPRQTGLLRNVYRVGRDEKYRGNPHRDSPVDLVDLPILKRVRLRDHQAFDKARVITVREDHLAGRLFSPFLLQLSIDISLDGLDQVIDGVSLLERELPDVDQFLEKIDHGSVFRWRRRGRLGGVHGRSGRLARVEESHHRLLDLDHLHDPVGQLVLETLE